MSKKIVWCVIGLSLMFLLIRGLSIDKSKINDIKKNAPVFLESHGFEVIAYQGYQWQFPWGGWCGFTMRKIPDNGLTYKCMILKRGGEYHLYTIRAIDAISTVR